MNVLKIILFILGIFLMFFAPLQLIVLAIIFFGIPFLIWIIEEKEKDINEKVKVEVKENKKRHKDLSKFYKTNKKRLK